ncbi:MAG: dihydrodipicolinate synthase family protein [Armatimonadota bacterium]|nr:dihydrodipicolinate synthase family protein [Armatimonadota bacterium]
MTDQPTPFLSGVIGLVNLNDPDWEETLQSVQSLLDCVALPGIPEQSWQPATRALLVQLCTQIKIIPILFGAAGIWPVDNEVITDGLIYSDQTVEMTKTGQAAGAACALTPTPVGLRPHPGQTTSAMVYRYFRDVQAKAALPLVIHQPKGLAAESRLAPESILSLVRMGKIAGLIMEDGTEEEFEANVRSGRRANFTVIGGGSTFPMALEWGAAGVAVDIRSPRLKEIAEQVHSRKPV